MLLKLDLYGQWGLDAPDSGCKKGPPLSCSRTSRLLLTSVLRVGSAWFSLVPVVFMAMFGRRPRKVASGCIRYTRSCDHGWLFRNLARLHKAVEFLVKSIEIHRKTDIDRLLAVDSSHLFASWWFSAVGWSTTERTHFSMTLLMHQ